MNFIYNSFNILVNNIYNYGTKFVGVEQFRQISGIRKPHSLKSYTEKTDFYYLVDIKNVSTNLVSNFKYLFVQNIAFVAGFYFDNIVESIQRKLQIDRNNLYHIIMGLNIYRLYTILVDVKFIEILSVKYQLMIDQSMLNEQQYDSQNNL